MIFCKTICPIQFNTLPPKQIMKNLISHEYLVAKLTQTLIQIAYLLDWDNGHCFFFGHTQANKVYPDQAAPEELSGHGILYLQKTTRCVTRAEWINSFSPGDDLTLAKKYTLIRQLLRSCLIRIYFICLCVSQEQTLPICQYKNYAICMTYYVTLPNKYS